MMNDKTRKVLPLVGALTLTASALLAGTGAAAAKPVPVAAFNSPHCDTVNGNADYDVNVDFMANNGKWVFVSVDVVTLQGRLIPTNHSTVIRHDMNGFLFVQATDSGNPAEPANVVVKIWDRKDVILNEQSATICP